jgi:primosomal protein N' (replication factor Y)
MALKKLFPHTPVIRIDRDTTSRKTAMHDLLEQVNRGEPSILVGTQMLAKGHHFANITLVAILDADSGLFSADFRGPERMGQLLVQVAGRSGRESKPGKVLIQTHQPEHPLLNSLITQSYHHFAQQLLSERQQSNLPPYSYMALIRADAKELPQAESFLRDMRRQLEQTKQPCSVLGPLPAPMTKKAGRFRAHLLLQSNHRRDLNQALQQLCELGDQHTLGKRLRWSIDVDPIDLF